MTDFSNSNSSHEKRIKQLEDMIEKDFAEDISHFLPIHVYIPNPTSEK